MSDQDSDLAGLRRFEVGSTVTGGIRVFCITCSEWLAEWSSRQEYPRVADLVEASEQHTCYTDMVHEPPPAVAP